MKLVTVLLASMSLISSFHHRAIRTTYQKKGLSASTVGRAEWADDESLAGLRGAPSRRRLSGPFLDNLVSSVDLRYVTVGYVFPKNRVALRLPQMIKFFLLTTLNVIGLGDRDTSYSIRPEHCFVLHDRVP